jgi:hypothetical protein
LENSVGKNPGTEAALALEPLLCANTQGQVHPIARSTLLNTEEPDSLNRELGSDQRVQVSASHKHIAASGGRVDIVGQVQFLPERVEHVHGKESDLAFVVLFVGEEAIPANALPGDTGQFLDFNHGMLAGGLAMVSEKVMSGRNEEMGKGNHTAIASWEARWR